MKKSIMAATILASLMSSTASADMIAGLYVGAQGWNMGTDGGFAYSSSLTDFSFDDESQGSFYVAVEHPIPLVPNVKIQRTSMDTNGDVTLTSNFTFNNNLFITSSSLTTDLDVSNTDYILYYELFDNDLITFDLGINGKYVDGSILVQDRNDISNNASSSFSGIVPMVYSKLALGLPLTGWGAFVEGSFLSIDDNTLYDYQAAVTYSLLDNIAVDLTVQLGYRSLTLELDDLDNIYTDLEFKGVFAGVEVHF